jgi:hypothetical protein
LLPEEPRSGVHDQRANIGRDPSFAVLVLGVIWSVSATFRWWCAGAPRDSADLHVHVHGGAVSIAAWSRRGWV